MGIGLTRLSRFILVSVRLAATVGCRVAPCHFPALGHFNNQKIVKDRLFSSIFLILSQRTLIDGSRPELLTDSIFSRVSKLGSLHRDLLGDGR